jgi:hypothetical protein
VKRCRADLVTEAGEHADHRDEHRFRHAMLLGRKRDHATADLRQIERLGQSEEPAHAVEHDPRRDASENDVLEPRLARFAVVHLVAGHDERDDADELERQIDHEQVAAHGHHVEAEGDGQEQDEELADPLLRFGPFELLVLGSREKDDHRRHRSKKRTEGVREAV